MEKNRRSHRHNGGIWRKKTTDGIGLRSDFKVIHSDQNNVRVTSQALESRRNYKMSWPQYAREQSQRAEIYRQQSAGADVRKEQIKVNWATRSVQMRAYLDDLYTKLRAAMR